MLKANTELPEDCAQTAPTSVRHLCQHFEEGTRTRIGVHLLSFKNCLKHSLNGFHTIPHFREQRGNLDAVVSESLKQFKFVSAQTLSAISNSFNNVGRRVQTVSMFLLW